MRGGRRIGLGSAGEWARASLRSRSWGRRGDGERQRLSRGSRGGGCCFGFVGAAAGGSLRFPSSP